MITQTRLVTAEELERMPQYDAHVELVKGQIVRTPLHGWLHGQVAGEILGLLGAFVR